MTKVDYRLFEDVSILDPIPDDGFKLEELIAAALDYGVRQGNAEAMSRAVLRCGLTVDMAEKGWLPDYVIYLRNLYREELEREGTLLLSSDDHNEIYDRLSNGRASVIRQDDDFSEVEVALSLSYEVFVTIDSVRYSANALLDVMRNYLLHDIHFASVPEDVVLKRLLEKHAGLSSSRHSFPVIADLAKWKAFAERLEALIERSKGAR